MESVQISSDEEDPLPRNVREKSGASSGAKRKARVLDSDSEEEEEKKPEKKKNVKVEKVEKKPDVKSVDPSDFFSKEQVKRGKNV